MIDTEVNLAQQSAIKEEAEKLTASSLVCAIWVVAGFIALSIGIIGIFLPILPTTSPLLLAAFCFARGSNRINNWLLNHKTLGPPINNWRKHGAISTVAKIQAVVMMSVSILLVWFIGLPLWVIAVQSITLILVAIFLLTRPAPPS